MKKITILSMLLIVAIFVGLVVFIASSEDFTPPYIIQKNLEDTKSWNKNVEDLLAALEKAGFVNSANAKQVENAENASQIWTVDGITVYYWDLTNMPTNATAYQTLVAVERDGILNGDAELRHLQNGPFVIEYTGYSGDAAALEEAFRNFGRVEDEEDADDSLVWTMKLDDLAAYLEASGLVNTDTRIKINFGADEKVRSGYRYNEIVDIYYYDQTMLMFEPGSSASNEWESINSSGTVVYVNGEVGTYYVRGPFVLHFYHWNRDAMTDEEKKVIIDYFMEFCKP